ncbi:MAG: efflux RND transporter permease subunit [Cytophagales bacterium]|nr:efflux RND transporter permease subunit [Cytophagales bacterium]
MLKSVRGLVAYFVKYPILANIIIALTLIAGIASLLGTKKSFFPSRKINNISIQVAYPGASPEEMEEGVTTKIEEAINSIVGIDEVNSNSGENSASISITVLESYDIDEVYTEVKNAVDAISSFPQDAEKPVIYKIKPTTPAQWVAITGDVDLFTLKKYSEDVEDDLLASGVVSQVNLMGFNDREISIEVSEKDLRRYGLKFDEVADAVRLNNRDISAGSIKASSEEILIRSNAKETDAVMIGEIVLRSNSDGSKLLLREVGTIKEQFTDAPNKWTINGQRAVFIQVLKLEDEDLEEISDYMNAYADEFNASNSVVQMIVSFDFMDYLNQRLEMLTSNGLIGLSLVLVALGLFLSLRLSAWVAWGIPSSFLGMFILGIFFGLTINMISLFGMILVIGILVDDGIVIAENIYSHFEKTGNPIKAAVNGTMEVLPAVTTSVTTTIVAFMPLFFLTGGFEFLKDMAFVVVASLSFSLLEAFFVLPAHLASKSVLSVKSEKSRSYKIRKHINRFVDWMRYGLYGNVLKYTMKYRVISICLLIGLFPIIAGLFGGGFIKATFFPRIPFTNFNIDIAFKPGTREQVTDKYLKRFENIVWEVNDELKEEIEDEENIVKFTFSGLGSTSDGSDAGSHAGQISVFYKELDGTGINEFDIIDRIREKIGMVPDAEKLLVGGEDRFGKPISIRLLGANYNELQEAREDLKAELRKITELKDIQDNVQIGRREMLFDLKPEAYFLGLTHNDITKQVRQGFFGEEVQRLQKGSDEVRVWVRYPESDRINIGQLEDMKVKVNEDGEYPLTQLTSYSVERGLSGIRHFNTKRAITVEADMVDPFGEVPPIIKNVQESIIPDILAKYPSVEVDYGGQSKESERAQSQIGLFFGGAFLLIFFILMITFRSFYQAVMIIAMIPLGWIGACIGHGIERLPVSLLSAWGMIALSGVIINDAVVFLAKFNTLIKSEGQSVYQAAYNAGIARFRPIMLTSITTVSGLWPLIMETSFQAQFLIPMAVSVAYGVLIGTFIILLFFPVLILFFNDVRRYAKWLWTGDKPTREDVERVLIDERRLQEYRESA